MKEMGTITWQEFLTFAKEITSVSDRLCDGWRLETIREESVGEVYLMKKELRSLASSNNEESKIQKGRQLQIWEYNILYSPSYSVPVLYFKVSDSTGRYLHEDEIIAELNIEPNPSQNIRNVISQTEHPILRKPFYYLHPCHTSELVIAPSSNNKLISWFSCVANIIKLNLNVEYAKL